MSRKIFIREQFSKGVILYSPFIQVKWLFGLFTDYEVVKKRITFEGKRPHYHSKEYGRKHKLKSDFYSTLELAISAAEEYLKENP